VAGSRPRSVAAAMHASTTWPTFSATNCPVAAKSGNKAGFMSTADAMMSPMRDPGRAPYRAHTSSSVGTLSRESRSSARCIREGVAGPVAMNLQGVTLSVVVRKWTDAQNASAMTYIL
jgi:hypothetical protein